MTLRETLLAVRAIVVDANPSAYRCGCIEDAICRVETGKCWFAKDGRSGASPAEQALDAVDPTYRNHELRQLPAYKALLAVAKQKWNYTDTLYSYSDRVTKAERLALIDEVISQL